MDSMKALVERHNALADVLPGRKRRRWFPNRRAASKAIAEMEAEKAEAERNQASSPQSGPPAAIADLARELDEPEATGDDDAKPADALFTRGDYRRAIAGAGILDSDIIRVASEKLLIQRVTSTLRRDDGRLVDLGTKPYGVPYHLIIRHLKKVFPGAATSVKCLRWYGTRLREMAGDLDPRVRAKPELMIQGARPVPNRLPQPRDDDGSWL